MLKLKYEWKSEAFFSEFQSFCLGLGKSDKETGSPHLTQRHGHHSTDPPHPHPQGQLQVCTQTQHPPPCAFMRMPFGGVELAGGAGREKGLAGRTGREGLAGRGCQGGAAREEGLAPFLSLMETTSLKSKGNNLS